MTWCCCFTLIVEIRYTLHDILLLLLCVSLYQRQAKKQGRQKAPLHSKQKRLKLQGKKTKREIPESERITDLSKAYVTEPRSSSDEVNVMSS